MGLRRSAMFRANRLWESAGKLLRGGLGVEDMQAGAGAALDDHAVVCGCARVEGVNDCHSVAVNVESGGGEDDGHAGFGVISFSMRRVGKGQIPTSGDAEVISGGDIP